MRLFHADTNTEAMQHDGVRYEPDEHGAFDLPHELAQRLLDGFPHLWTVAPQPEPAAAARKPAKRSPKPKPAEPEDESRDEEPEDEEPEDEEPKDEEPSDAEPGDTDESEPVKEGDGDDAPSPARAPSAKRAPSRRASS